MYGPYWAEGHLERQDIRAGEKGLYMRLAMQVIDVQTCMPVHGARVGVWQVCIHDLSLKPGIQQANHPTLGQFFGAVHEQVEGGPAWLAANLSRTAPWTLTPSFLVTIMNAQLTSMSFSVRNLRSVVSMLAGCISMTISWKPSRYAPLLYLFLYVCEYRCPIFRTRCCTDRTRSQGLKRVTMVLRRIPPPRITIRLGSCHGWASISTVSA